MHGITFQGLLMKFSLFLCCGAEIIIDYIYVNDLQWTRKQLKSTNQGLQRRSRECSAGMKMMETSFHFSHPWPPCHWWRRGQRHYKPRARSQVPFDSIKPRPLCPRLHPHNCFNAVMTRLWLCCECQGRVMITRNNSANNSQQQVSNITTAVTGSADWWLVLCGPAWSHWPCKSALRTPDLSKNTQTRTSCLSLTSSALLSQWQEMDHSYLNQSGRAWAATVDTAEWRDGSQLGGECCRREIQRKKQGLINSLFTQNLVHLAARSRGARGRYSQTSSDT